MFIRMILPLLLAAGSAEVSARQSTAGRAADRFSLDMPAPDANTTPSTAAGATAEAPPAAAPVAADPVAVAPLDSVPLAGATVAYTLDTPIHDLIANTATRAVLDRNLPGLSTDENLPKFDQMGLRAFQPLTGGQLTGPMLAQMAKDLAKVSGAPLKIAPTRTGARRTRGEAR